MSKASRSKDNPSSRRGTEDQERDKLVYKFLLSRLTDLDLKDNERPNEYSIAAQWGQNRIYIRRVLRSVWTEKYPEEEREDIVPKLTLGKLVEILTAISTYRKKQKLKTPVMQIPRILTRSEKLTALRKFSQLLLEEQEQLNLAIGSEDLLLQQLLDTITDPVRGLERDNKIFFYQNAIKIYEDLKKTEVGNWQKRQHNKSQTEDKSELIETKIAQVLEEYYEGLHETIKQEKLRELSGKVRREINKIEYKSGIRQVKQFLGQQSQDNKSLDVSDAFIERLTVSLIENEILIKEFPIYLDYFEVERIPTLPLYFEEPEESNATSTSATKTRLLNSKLLDLDDEDWENIIGLEKELVYTVKVHFSVKVPEGYNPIFGEDLSRKISVFKNDKLEFYEEVKGIGSVITHIVAAINRLLLWDIPVLEDYLPVARELFNKDEVLGQSTNSPFVSYTVVNLCKKEDVQKAIKEDKEYDKISTNQDLAYGEYCGFDLVEASAEAARYARLKAIKQTGIDPKEYLTQLCNKIEEKNALMKAESYLEFYPFSLRAMEGYLNQTIFNNQYREHDKEFNFTEIDSKKPWSLVAYNAHLKITAAYLREGLYRVAKKFLDVIKVHQEDGRLNNRLLLAKYYFSQFRYYYMTEAEDQDYYPYPERPAAVNQAQEMLDAAEKELREYLKEYQKIGQASQTNFNPFFYLVSRVFAHRMKLYLFTHLYSPPRKNNRKSLREAMNLLEKARIYASRDGSIAHYAYWTTYQAWCYLMTAFLEPDGSGFTKENCLNWAKKLIDHAKLCYSYTGEICYKQIKDKAGRIPEDVENYEDKYYEKYGSVRIQVMPLIQEQKECKEDQYNIEKHILTISLSELITDDNQPTYLFGHHSAIILFGMGMLKLCGNETELESKIKKAKKIFVYCLSTASEGGVSKDKTQGNVDLYINRKPSEEELNNSSKEELNNPDNKYNNYTNIDQFNSWIKILYPHRLTQFVDLGKIFAATCEAILLLHDSKYEYNSVKILLKSLCDNDNSPNSHLQQKHYNGHLKSAKEEIIRYFENLNKSPINGSIIEIRDRVVKDIFEKIRK